ETAPARSPDTRAAPFFRSIYCSPDRAGRGPLPARGTPTCLPGIRHAVAPRRLPGPGPPRRGRRPARTGPPLPSPPSRPRPGEGPVRAAAAPQPLPDPFFAFQRACHLRRLGADRWHAVGWRGRGVKIAVLDSSFRGYRAQLGRALPARVGVRSFRADGDLEAR